MRTEPELVRNVWLFRDKIKQKNDETKRAIGREKMMINRNME